MALQHQGGSLPIGRLKRSLEVAAELFYQQWGTEAGERLGRLDAQVNLCNYLMDADWGLVAEGAGGELLGVLLAETGSQPAAALGAWRTRREELLAQVAPGAITGREVCRVEAESAGALAAVPRRGGREWTPGGSGGVQAPDCEPGCPRAGRRRRPREPWRGPSCADGSRWLLPHHGRHL